MIYGLIGVNVVSDEIKAVMELLEGLFAEKGYKVLFILDKLNKYN
jgi:hypothetical protein